MVKIRRLVKQTFQTFQKLVLAEKWLKLIVFGVAIIQLLSRKGAPHSFNVPNRYLITKPKSMNTIKNIFRINYLKNFEIVLEYFQVCQWNTALREKKKENVSDVWSLHR